MFTPAILALENGRVFRGEAIGAMGSVVGEVVFNTAMSGYQEILTDPSYAKQIVTLTYPHIGNTGCNSEDEESSSVWAQGLIIRDLPLVASNYRSQEDLSHYLKRNNILGIAEIDTRALTQVLRQQGALSGCIMAGDDIDEAAAIEQAKAFKGLKGMDLAQHVTTDAPFEWRSGSWIWNQGFSELSDANEQFHVVAYDFGAKRNILLMLVDRGCRLTVVPATTPADAVLAMQPDGVFLSNGPGDPEPCTYAISAIQQILTTDIPVFGICLGHQLLGLASGASTLKMKFGHHGANHPVQDLRSQRVMITSQNHGFAIDDSHMPECLEVTHVSLFDGSVQGIQRKDKPAFSFQGHPEASPGPHDAAHLFDHFIELMTARKED